MSISKDGVINIAFGSVMVLIGVAGIWIVKWSTDKMILASHRTVPDEENLIAIPTRSDTVGEMAAKISRTTLISGSGPPSISSFDEAGAANQVAVNSEISRTSRSNSW